MTVHVSPESCPALGAERRFPAAQLLSAFALVLAGCDQGGVPRSRAHRLELRPGDQEPELRDVPAERGVAQGLCEAGAAPGVHAVQRVPARPLPVPVLRRQGRPDLRSRHPALARAAARPGTTSSPPARRAISRRPTGCPARSRCGRMQAPFQPTVHDLHNNGRAFPPNHLHESWLDYLYWDIELEE